MEPRCGPVRADPCTHAGQWIGAGRMKPWCGPGVAPCRPQAALSWAIGAILGDMADRSWGQGAHEVRDGGSSLQFSLGSVMRLAVRRGALPTR